MEKESEQVVSFFDRMLTEEEWDNPGLLRFANTEIPADRINMKFEANNATVEYYKRKFGLFKKE